MRLISKAILMGATTLVLAGTAYAADKSLHPVQTNRPDGSVVQVSYNGDRQAEVAFVPVRAAPSAVVPVAVADSRVADVNSLFASLDAQMAAMMRAASALPAMPMTADGKPDMVAMKSMPGGAVSYSYYSSSTGANGCTRTVQMSSTGSDQQPRIVKTSSGDCGTEPADTSAANQKASATAPAAKSASKPAAKDTI